MYSEKETTRHQETSITQTSKSNPFIIWKYKVNLKENSERPATHIHCAIVTQYYLFFHKDKQRTYAKIQHQADVQIISCLSHQIKWHTSRDAL